MVDQMKTVDTAAQSADEELACLMDQRANTYMLLSRLYLKTI